MAAGYAPKDQCRCGMKNPRQDHFTMDCQFTKHWRAHAGKLLGGDMKYKGQSVLNAIKLEGTKEKGSKRLKAEI